MRAHNVPDWYIASCKKIKYMFPKAHAVAYDMAAIRLAWFKIYKPLEFYAAYFSVAPGGFDATAVLKGRSYIKKVIEEINERDKKDVTAKDAETVSTLLRSKRQIVIALFIPRQLFIAHTALALVIGFPLGIVHPTALFKLRFRRRNTVRILVEF